MDWEYPVHQPSSPRLKAPEDGIVSATHRSHGWLATAWSQMYDADQKTYASRLARGRTLARSGRVRDLWFSPGLAAAEVVARDVNRVSLRIRVFNEPEWKALIAVLLKRLDLIASLLEGELPRELVEILTNNGLNLLPSRDEVSGDCQCSDYLSPCEHMAAVHTVLAEALDGEPFLLLTLRGRPREQLINDLRLAWGDTAPIKVSRPVVEELPPDVVDWFRSPEVLPSSMQFHVETREEAGTAIGLRALGPPPAKGDLFRALAPLYEAGAAAAASIAHDDVRRSHERDDERRRPSRREETESMLPVSKGRMEAPEAQRVGRRTFAPPPVDKSEPRTLTERVVDAIRQLEPVRTRDIADLLDISMVMVRNELLELERTGVVKRTGQTRATRWWVG